MIIHEINTTFLAQQLAIVIFNLIQFIKHNKRLSLDIIERHIYMYLINNIKHEFFSFESDIQVGENIFSI